MGASTCALFLSVKYHVLKPTYIYGRMEQASIERTGQTEQRASRG